MNRHRGAGDMFRALHISSFVLLMVSMPALAWHAPMVVDSAFGRFVPQLDSSHPLIAPVVSVHLPISGGYLMITEQTVGSVNKLVATKFTEDGAIESDWPSPGGSGTTALAL